MMDAYIPLIGQAQTSDGYLFTYNQIHFPGQRWVNLQVEHELYCHGHLIEAGVSHFQATVEMATSLTWMMTSALPFGGNIHIQLAPAAPILMTIHLRLPSWAGEAEVWVNGEVVAVPPAAAYPDVPAQGYDPRQSRFLSLRRVWQAGDTITLTFPLPIVALQPHPRMKGYEGKKAFTRGPLVYCLKSADNPEIDVLTATVDAAVLQPEWESELLGGDDGVTWPH